jgi:outer membrane lipoprotein SlyB
MDTQKRALHPLLQAAAVSLIVFSAVGVAAITGLIPASKGSVKDASTLATAQAPAEAPGAQPDLAPTKPAPAPKPAKKRAVNGAPKPLPAPAPVPATTAYEPVAQTPRTIEAPQPAVKPGQLGFVESVRQVEEAGDAKGIGAVGGGIAGAVIGHNMGEHNKLVTVLGAAGGALLGNHIEKQARAKKHWELTVRLDDGTIRKVSSEAEPFWHQGDRVRLLDGKLVPA